MVTRSGASGLFEAAIVSYSGTDCVIQVHCATSGKIAAVERFARASGFACPAPKDLRPVLACHATTHPNGEVLWG